MNKEKENRPKPTKTRRRTRGVKQIRSQTNQNGL